MAEDHNDQATIERRAWADNEFKIYRPGEIVPTPSVDDNEGNDDDDSDD